MTPVTSPRFASIATSGADWREIARHILAALEPLRDRPDPFNLGFLYVSDSLAADLGSLLNLIRAVTGVEHWVGAVGLGVCGSGIDYIDTPAAAVMLGSFPPGSFQIFPATDLMLGKTAELLEPWLDDNDPMLMLVHGDPLADTDPTLVLQELERFSGAFIAGGLSSSREQHLVIAGHVASGGIGGVIFSDDVRVATALTQGCAPLGPVHTLTRYEESVILELDGRNAFEVFSDDLKTMAVIRKGGNPDKMKITETVFTDDETMLDSDIENLFRGEIHIAFPVPGSDQDDYMVRNITSLDPDSGHIGVAQSLEPGQHILFVHRDDKTIQTDLTRALTALRDRLIRENGIFAPQGAVYVSCVARAQASFGIGFGAPEGEMRMVRDLLGDIPLAGFYANGEISNRRLYGYTGVLILFL